MCLNVAMSSMRSHRRPVAAVLAAAILFGTTGTAQALGPKFASPLSIGAVRVTIGALGLIVLTTRTRPRPRLRKGLRTRSAPRPSAAHRWALALAGVGVAGYQIGFFEGTKRAGVALGTLVALGSGPVFAGVFQAIRSRRLPSVAWTLATLLAASGAGLVAFARHDTASGVSLMGIAAALLAGLSYAVFSMASKHAMVDGLASLDAMAASFAIGAVLMSPLLFTEPLHWLASGRGIGVALDLGLGATTAAYALFGFGLARLAVPTVVTLTLAEPATAAVLSVVALSQHLAPVGWLGVTLVLVGVGVVARTHDEPGLQPQSM